MKISEIKTNARTLLMGEHSRFGLDVLFYLLIRFIAAFLPSLVFSNISTPMLFISALLLSYMLEVLSDMFSVGLSRISLHICRNENHSFYDIFYAFKNQSDQFLKIRMLFAAINAALDIPVLLLPQFIDTSGLSDLLYYVIVAGGSLLTAFISFLITLRLEFSIYLMFDNRSLTAGSALKESLKLTKGQYRRLFALQISFIGMHILSIFSFFFGYLLTVPYIKTSEALLYEEMQETDL